MVSRLTYTSFHPYIPLPVSTTIAAALISYISLYSIDYCQSKLHYVAYTFLFLNAEWYFQNADGVYQLRDYGKGIFVIERITE